MRKAILAACMAMVVASVAVAQQVTPNIDVGTKHARLNGRLDTDTPLNFRYSLGIGGGYFVMDQLEVGGVFAITGDDASTTLGLGAFAQYYFDLGSAWVPFVAGGLSYEGTELDDQYFNIDNELDYKAPVFTLGGGVLWFLRDEVAISVRGDYGLAGGDLYIDQDGNKQDSNFVGRLGLHYYWD
jgi:hypothetical protein